MIKALPLALASAIAALSPPANAGTPVLPGPDEAFHFLGTEPFWGGEVRGGWMKLEWPDNAQGVGIRVTRSMPGRRLVITGRLTKHPHFMPAGRFTMTVVRRECSDGMSERTYPYDVIIVAGTSRVTGCGYTARRPVREGPDG